MTFRRILPVLAVALLAAPALLGEPAKERRNVIRVPVWVASPDALKMDSMQARATNTDARVVALNGPGEDLMLLIVLDMVDDLALIEPAREALVKAVEEAGPRTHIGVLRAQDGLKVLADPARDRAPAIAAIRAFPVSGKAGLIDTVETATHLADAILAKSSVRVAVLYVTDSDVRNYREDFTNPVINSSDSHDLSRRFPEGLVQEKFSKLEVQMAARQAPLFLVHLNYRSDRLNEAYQNGLKQLASNAAGAAIFCRTPADIPQAVAQIVDQIAAHYSVTLELPGSAGKSVEVALESSGLSLSHRTRFVLKER
ncbi:MAG: hypothetical protein WD696_20125 [Bryobacteraceae bacterium]